MRWKLARWKLVILKNLKSYRLSRAFRLYIIVLPVIQFQLNNAESRWDDCCSLMKNKCRWSEFAGDNVPWFCFRSEFVFFFLLVSFACLADPWLMILIFWKKPIKKYKYIRDISVPSTISKTSKGKDVMPGTKHNRNYLNY